MVIVERRPAAAQNDEEDDDVDLSMEEDEKVKYAGMIMRYMLGRHLSKQMISRADISKIFPEELRGRRNFTSDSFKLARKLMKSRLGMEVIEVHRRVKQRGTTGISQTARNVLSQGPSQGGAGHAKYYILVSALPTGMRPPPDDKAIVGLITTIASLILLEPHFKVEEKALYRHMESLGAKKNGKVYTHPQIENLSQLIEVDFPRQGYFDREKDGNLFFMSFGPRLKGEITTEGLISILDEAFGSEMDEVTKKELALRADGLVDDDSEED